MDKPENSEEPFFKAYKKSETQHEDTGEIIVKEKFQENQGDIETQTEYYLKGYREKLNAEMMKDGLSILVSVYLIVAIEHLPALIMLILCYFFDSIITVFLVSTALVVVAIYFIAYFIVYRFSSLVKGTIGFLFAIVLSICEAFLFAYLSHIISIKWLITLVTILVLNMFIITVIANCFKEKYKIHMGIITAAFITTTIFIIYMLIIDYNWFLLIISYLLTNIYQIFIIIIIDKILKKMEIKDDENIFKTSIYVTLVIFRKKVELTFGLVIYIIISLVKLCKKKEDD